MGLWWQLTDRVYISGWSSAAQPTVLRCVELVEGFGRALHIPRHVQLRGLRRAHFHSGPWSLQSTTERSRIPVKGTVRQASLPPLTKSIRHEHARSHMNFTLCQNNTRVWSVLWKVWYGFSGRCRKHMNENIFLPFILSQLSLLLGYFWHKISWPITGLHAQCNAYLGTLNALQVTFNESACGMHERQNKRKHHSNHGKENFGQASHKRISLKIL